MQKLLFRRPAHSPAPSDADPFPVWRPCLLVKMSLPFPSDIKTRQNAWQHVMTGARTNSPAEEIL